MQNKLQEFLLEEDNPSTRKRGGVLPPNHLLSPAPLGATTPRPRVYCVRIKFFNASLKSAFDCFFN